MPVIHIPRGLAVAQVEIPESEGDRRLERSCKGAVHLRPGIKVVTNDELTVIEKVLPKIFKRLRVVSDTDEERAEKERVSRKLRRRVQLPAPEPTSPTPKVPDQAEDKQKQKQKKD